MPCHAWNRQMIEAERQQADGSVARYGVWGGFLLLVVIAVWGVPFQYDTDNSGRYLTYVVQAADPALFPEDSAVDSFRRFGSLFYKGLEWLVREADIRPADIEPLMHRLFDVSQVLLLVLVWGLARRFSTDPLMFILLGAWYIFKQKAMLGGAALTFPSMTHGTVALMLGLASLYILLKGNVLGFWLLAGVAVFIHSLMALHLVVCVVPAWYFVHRRFSWQDVVGGLCFAGCVLAYKFWFAPPTMSPEEAAIFLEARSSMYHVSPLSQGLLTYVHALLLMVLVGMTYRYAARYEDAPGKAEEKTNTFLWGAVLSGSVFALGLGLLAAAEVSVTLVQVQPMRIFTWVTAFVYLLLAQSTIRILRQRDMVGVALLGVWMLELIPSKWWWLAMVMLTIGCMGWVFLTKQRNTTQYHGVVGGGVSLLVLVMGVGWIFRDIVSLGPFQKAGPVLGGLLLLFLVGLYASADRRRWLGMAAGVFLVGTAAVNSWATVRETNPAKADWLAVQDWCATHTAKADQFIIVDGEDNFRVRAHRTGEGESMAALVWVDPLLHQHYAQRRQQIKQASGKTPPWDLETLMVLAQTWEYEYVLTRGAVQSPSPAAFEAGPYQVFAVPALHTP